jgi:transposase
LPQWGPLTDTWARRGPQPRVKPSGQRKGSKVFGLIASFPGRFFYQGQAGRLHAAASLALLTRVLEQTRQPLVLMQDGAQDHPSAETKAFCAQQAARLQVFPWPTYAPDDNPIAKLWKKSKQHETHRHSCPTLEAWTDKVEQARLTLTHTPAEILALCSLPTA